MTLRSKLVLASMLAFLVSMPPAQATHEGCNHFRDGSDGAYYIIGTDGSDHCHGTDLDETMGGNAAADDLSGRAGRDNIYGHEGHDLLNGDSWGDFMEGYAGDDRIVGGSGDDTLRDTLFGSDFDRICDNGGLDDIRLDDGDAQDIWYREPNDGFNDTAVLGPNDSINSGGCPLPGS